MTGFFEIATLPSVNRNDIAACLASEALSCRLKGFVLPIYVVLPILLFLLVYLTV